MADAPADPAVEAAVDALIAAVVAGVDTTPDEMTDVDREQAADVARSVLVAAVPALLAEQDRLAAQLAAVPALWSCPDCAFTFDAMHTDADGGYSCPACAETRLAAQLDRYRQLLAGLNDYIAAAEHTG